MGCGRLSPRRLGRSAAERAYLKAVIEQHRYLPILPTTLVPVIAGPEVKELDEVYVALTIGDNTGASAEARVSSAIESNPRLVLVGDPGSGKTTLLRYLTLTFARARRGASIGRDKKTKLVEREKVQQARVRVESEYNLSSAPLPVFVYMNRLHDVLDWPHDRTLLDYLEEEFKPFDSLSRGPSTLRARYERGECVFLFDAFDELATDLSRARVANLIGDLSARAPAGNRFIVSSRKVGYHGQLTTSGFRTLTIQKLSWSLVTNLVTNWYTVLGHPGLAERLLESFIANPRLFALAENPMLLSLIVLVQYVLPLIPDKRHVLYEECVRVLIERRYAPPAIQAAYSEALPADEAGALLRRIAFRMHKEKLREVSRERLEGQLLPSILEEMQFSKAAQLQPAVIIKNIEERSQLLVERGLNEEGKPIMAFSHLTFQEYFVSSLLHSNMASRGKSLIIDELLSLYRADADWWQEIAVLFAAQLQGIDQPEFLASLKRTGA